MQKVKFRYNGGSRRRFLSENKPEVIGADEVARHWAGNLCKSVGIGYLFAVAMDSGYFE